MSRKLIFLAVVAIGGALPFAVSALASQHQEAVCFGSPATITGSGEINGTDGDDVIVGSDGSDRIRAHVGDDKVCSGGGDDRIGGGPGNDEIDGGPGNDDIHSGSGNDVVLGGEGDDAIHCGPDDDVADGGPGRNIAETAGFEACESVTNALLPQGQRVKANLSARQVVPLLRRPARGTGGGVFSATLTPTAAGATLAWRLTFKGLSGRALTAHVHQGRPGKAGPVLVRLCGPCRADTIATSQVAGEAARMAILQGSAYVDVHTARTSRGEIRGQILRVGP